MIALVARNLETARRELEERRLDFRETVFVTPGNVRSTYGHRFTEVIWVPGWDSACSAERALEVTGSIARASVAKP